MASIFNGFSAPQYRWHYITFLFIAATISLGVQNIFYAKFDKKSIIQLLFSFLMTAVLYIIALNRDTMNLYDNRIILFVLLLYFFIFVTGLIMKNRKSRILFLSVGFLSSVYFIVMQNDQMFHQYDLVTVNDESLYQKFDDLDSDFSRALKIVEDDADDFYRIDYTGTINMGMQKGVNTFNAYSSFLNGNLQEFYRYYNILNYRDGNRYTNGLAGRQTLNSLFQVDYILAEEENKYIIPTAYSEIGNVNGLGVYKNNIPLSFIHPVDNLYSIEDVDNDDFKDELLIDGAIVPEEYSNTDLPDDFANHLDFTIQESPFYQEDIIDTAQETAEIEINIEENSEEYQDVVIDYTLIPLEDTRNSNYTVNGNQIGIKSLNDTYSSQLTRHQIHLPFNDQVTFEFSGNSKYRFIVHKITATTNNELEERKELEENLNYNHKIENGSIEINFENEHHFPYMVLPIIYDENWILNINGDKGSIIETNNGMVGFKIPEDGEMVIELNYISKGLIVTLIIAIGSIGIIVIDYKKNLI